MAQEQIATDIVNAIGTNAEAMRADVEAITTAYVAGGGNITRQYEACIDGYNAIKAAAESLRHVEAITENAPPTPGFNTGLEDN